MSLLYSSGWYVGGANTMSALVDGNAAAIPTGYYAHAFDTAFVEPAPSDSFRTAGAWSGQSYTAFADVVAAALNLASGPGFSVFYSAVTGLYTISKAGTFTLNWTVADPVTRLAAAMGFTADLSGSNSYTSSVLPVYQMLSAVSGRSNVVGPYEPDDIAEESVSDGGVDFVVTRKTSELLMSWTQDLEPRSAVYAQAAAASSFQYSWQEWFRHTRGTHPFIVAEALEGEPDGAVYRLTAKGAVTRPRRYTADYDGEWSLPFETHWLGKYAP